MVTILTKQKKEIWNELDHFRKTLTPCVNQKPCMKQNGMKWGNGCLLNCRNSEKVHSSKWLACK